MEHKSPSGARHSTHSVGARTAHHLLLPPRWSIVDQRSSLPSAPGMTTNCCRATTNCCRAALLQQRRAPLDRGGVLRRPGRRALRPTDVGRAHGRPRCVEKRFPFTALPSTRSDPLEIVLIRACLYGPGACADFTLKLRPSGCSVSPFTALPLSPPFLVVPSSKS